MDDTRYWLWLQEVVGIGVRIDNIIEAFGSAKAIYDFDEDTLRESGFFSETRLEKSKNKDLSKYDEIINYCKANDHKILTYDMPNYPESLKLITDAPLALYLTGDETLLDNDRLRIGVIGARKPSEYGLSIAGTMAKALAQNGAIVVSGGALGIDTAAHLAAIEAGSKTITILGCGAEFEYPKGSLSVREKIRENGLIVSEYPPKTGTSVGSFVKRNRITSGLCKGVLVVEAGEKSGTLSTAKMVQKYNRDLFVVTGDARGTNFLGANELAQKGANIVFSAEDIFNFYGQEIINRDSFDLDIQGKTVFTGIDVYPYGKSEPPEKKPVKRKRNPKKEVKVEPKPEVKEEKHEIDLSLLSPDALAVYEAIGENGAAVDDIAVTTQLQIQRIIIAITELEMASAIRQSATSEYMRN